jgi:hypothetical protein
MFGNFTKNFGLGFLTEQAPPPSSAPLPGSDPSAGAPQAQPSPLASPLAPGHAGLQSIMQLDRTPAFNGTLQKNWGRESQKIENEVLPPQKSPQGTP